MGLRETRHQSVVQLGHCSGYEIREMLLVFASETRRQYSSDNFDHFALPTLKEQTKVTNPPQGAKSASDWVDPGLGVNAVRPVPIPGDDNDWKLEGKKGLDEAEQVVVKELQHDLYKSYLLKYKRFLRRSPRLLSWRRIWY